MLLMLAGRTVAALQIGPPIWSFDGKVMPCSFNVVSFEVRNAGAQPFDGDLVVDDGAGLGSRSSAPLKQRIFLAPGTSRWVQFFPYIGSYNSQWRLSWDDGQGRTVDLGQPGEGPPAVVLLADPDAPGTRATRMRLFPENLFPPTVAATDGLEGVVLDHQPRWDAQRRESFLDWVRRGGIVHLIPGPDGAFPQFSEELAPLNVPGDRGRVAAGLVVKHRVSGAEITEEWIRNAGFPAGEIRTDGEGQIHDVDGFALRKLAAVTRPNIAWGLIYFLTVVYVVLIGPVFYFLRKRDYRLMLGAFLVTVALFAWAFTVIGRRGYGEKQIYHSLAIARPLGGARFAVRQWIHPFATSGDIYRFQHAGGSHLYAALGEGETVRGEITTGKDAGFAADIPLFSSRPFLHAGVMKAEDPGVTVSRWEVQDAKPKGDSSATLLTSLAVAMDSDFRKRVFTAVLDQGGRYWLLTATADGFEIQPGNFSKSAKDFFSEHHFHDYGGWYGGDSGDMESVLRNLRELYPFLISQVNGESAYVRKYLRSNPRPADQARLFLFAHAPPGFGMKNESFQAGAGFVLYVVDIFKP
jgi:hypothetical protein